MIKVSDNRITRYCGHSGNALGISFVGLYYGLNLHLRLRQSFLNVDLPAPDANETAGIGFTLPELPTERLMQNCRLIGSR